MNYPETLDYLYHSLPVFHRVGAAAYKPGLETTWALDRFFDSPHRFFRSVHIAGTNGKGSVSQMMYESLRAAGHRVGIYTSPHLVDFRERIVVDGSMISEQSVVDFVARVQPFLIESGLCPSFFELTVAMAFDYFRNAGVDYAVVEVGLGGRLDSTNIITPELSVVTNISFDHTQFLGTTLPLIASEKAGIFKPLVPAVVGEWAAETAAVFEQKASETHSELIFADRSVLVGAPVASGMGGDYQQRNARTAQVALERLGVPYSAICDGIGRARVRGRWDILRRSPLVVVDTGHNVAGLGWVCAQLGRQRYARLYFVLGVVDDKDLSGILPLLPRGAHYLFTQASIPRAMSADRLATAARGSGLCGDVYSTIAEAVSAALLQATADDMVFIGGSTFTVAEALPLFDGCGPAANARPIPLEKCDVRST